MTPQQNDIPGMDLEHHEHAAAALARRKRRFRRALRIAVPTIVAAGVGGAIAVAATPGASPEVKACYATTGSKKGLLRLADRCARGEKALSWGKQGPRGLPGLDGKDGANGAPGADGAKGLDGLPGLIGLTGPAGPQGIQGIQGPTGSTGVQGPVGPAGPPGRDADSGPACSLARPGGAPSNGSLFLSLGASFPGEVRAKGYENQIELTGFCFTGAKATSGSPAEFDTFTVTKRVDKATPLLMSNVATAKSIAAGDVSFAKQTSLSLNTWRQYRFTNLRVVGDHIRMTTNGLMEQTTFAWEDVSIGYRRQRPDGALEAEQVSTIDRQAPEFTAPEIPSCSTAAPDDGGSIDGYMQFDQAIRGDATDAAHKEWSQADTFCFGLGATSSKSTAPTFTTFGLQKRTDSATGPVLTRFAGLKGGLLPQSVFAATRPGDKGDVEFFRLQFDDVTMRDYQQGVRGLPSDYEWMSFDWNALRLSYKPQNPDGSLGSEVIFSYDRATKG